MGLHRPIQLPQQVTVLGQATQRRRQLQLIAQPEQRLSQMAHVCKALAIAQQRPAMGLIQAIQRRQQVTAPALAILQFHQRLQTAQREQQLSLTEHVWKAAQRRLSLVAASSFIQVMQRHLPAHHLMDIHQMAVILRQITCLSASKPAKITKNPSGFGRGGFFYGVLSQGTLLARSLSD